MWRELCYILFYYSCKETSKWSCPLWYGPLFRSHQWQGIETENLPMNKCTQLSVGIDDNNSFWIRAAQLLNACPMDIQSTTLQHLFNEYSEYHSWSKVTIPMAFSCQLPLSIAHRIAYTRSYKTTSNGYLGITGEIQLQFLFHFHHRAPPIRYDAPSTHVLAVFKRCNKPTESVSVFSPEIHDK